MRELTVDVAPRPYGVVVGLGALDAIPKLVAGRRTVALVTHPELDALYGEAVAAELRAGGANVVTATMPPGEAAKSLTTVEALCRTFAAGGLLRDDVIVALGGGVVGDTAGFAASVYYRGVDVVQVPTTLLAQVDSAIGGKTAVNLPEGKNLVGAFHQSIGVVADVATLATVPAREYRAGLGEVAKYALMPEGTKVSKLLDEHGGAVLGRDAEVLTDLVAECIAIKVAVVERDPEERTGERAQLNLGHTFAHALETVGRYDDIAHGEAVAVGLVFAVALAESLDRVPAGSADGAAALVSGLGLPARVAKQCAASELLAVMRRDKKASGGLSFILPSADGLSMVHDPPPAALDAAMEAVGVPTST